MTTATFTEARRGGRGDGPRPKALLAFAATAFQQAAAERAAVVSRLGFYAVVLGIFSRLWLVVAESGQLGDVTSTELLWYLALTEWVVLAVPLVHLQIEAEIRSGDIAYTLTRPVHYPLARLSEAAGELALRLLVLAPFGVALALLYTGELPRDPRGLLLALPIGVLAAWVTLCFHATIGLCAFWLQDCSPVYWLWQKAAFVLGGLMLPLEIYPGWLRELAMWTPFSAIMHGTGRMAFGFDPGLAAAMFAKLLVWAAVASATLWLTYRRALRRLDLNGG